MRTASPLKRFFFIQAPIRLKSPRRTYALHFDQYYRVLWNEDRNEYKVKTHSCSYRIADDETIEELFAFHWEPHSKVTYPHLHIGFGMRNCASPTGNRAHIPTGRVPIEGVIAFLIHDLSVAPLCGDADEIIGRARERFVAHKSW